MCSGQLRELHCGPKLPKLTDENADEIKAHWDAYRDHWVDELRASPATWLEIAQTFKHMARREEFLASALMFTVEGMVRE
jgi:hypothetical protein